MRRVLCVARQTMNKSSAAADPRCARTNGVQGATAFHLGARGKYPFRAGRLLSMCELGASAVVH